MNHIQCVLASMVHVALRRITVQYQIQISDENTCIYIAILTELQILQLNKMIFIYLFYLHHTHNNGIHLQYSAHYI